MGKTFLISFLLLPLFSIAQKVEIKPISRQIDNNKGLQITIVNEILRNCNTELLTKTPKDEAHILSIALSFDETGKVDTIYFSESIRETTIKSLKIDTGLIKKIKQTKLNYKEYSSKIVLFPILFIRAEDDKIGNRTDFIHSFENLWPDAKGFNKDKEIILLPPYVNTYFRSSH